MLAGCPQGPGPFDNYVGVNLIEDQGVFGFQAIPSKWVLDAAAVYRNFESYSAVDVPTGAPTGAEAWRLEIKNLVLNGDFEATVPPAAPVGWASVGGATLETVSGTSESLDGVTMRLYCADGSQMVDLDVRAAAADGFNQYNTYFARFDYRTNKDGIVFEYNNMPVLPPPEGTWTWKADGDTEKTFTGRYTFPPTDIVPTVTVNAAAQQHYLFNSLLSSVSRKIEGYVDNFRLIRTNQSYFVRMPIADGEAALPLVAGAYRFSAWVKRDPDVTPAELNRFLSSAVELSIKRIYETVDGETSTITAVKAFHDGVEVDLSDGQWHQVWADLPSQEWQTEGATVSMEVGISPTDETLGAGSLDCGSILIAAPGLEMLPDGF